MANNRKIHSVLVITMFLFLFCVYANGQEKYQVSDIKGTWLSNLFYDEDNDEYVFLPSEKAISFAFTESKGKLNQARYTGLYCLFSDGAPKLFYYSLGNNTIHLFDSSDSPLPFCLEIESLIPRVAMTAILKLKEEGKTTATKLKFLYYQKVQQQ